MEIESTQQSHLLLTKEIIEEEILPKLPVKSLLRFKCVAKSWLSLIGDKRFIKTQLQNSTKNTSLDDQRQRVVLFPKKNFDDAQQCSLLSLLNKKPDIHALEMDFFPTGDLNCSISLVGCCDGLVCAVLKVRHLLQRVGLDFILWNPSTRTSKKLPRIEINMLTLLPWCFGFCWDESSDDYKVVAMFSDIKEHHRITCEIYSMKSDSWKKVDGSYMLYGIAGGVKQGKIVKGKLHWDFHSWTEWEIVAFDLKREVFENVEQPCYSDGSSWGCFGVLEDRLLVCRWYYPPNYGNESDVDIWVMKEYGVKESWEKLMKLVHDRLIWSSPSMASFCVSREGGNVLIKLRSLMIYDAKDQTTAYPVLSYDADVFVESLVSPLG